MTTTNPESAYTAAHMTAQDLLARIGEWLQDMPAPGDEEHEINWSHVATLGEMTRRLAEETR